MTDADDPGEVGPTAESPAAGDESPGGETVDAEVLDDSTTESADVDEAELARIHAALDDLTPGAFSASGNPSPSGGSLTCEEALEGAVDSLERVTAERDEYIDLVQRLKADFDNFRRRTDAQRVEQVERAEESLVAELLAVLDACDAAVDHGADEVAPIHTSIIGILERRGLEVAGVVGDEFDPNLHEAVLSEPGDDDDDGGPQIAEVMRSGYLWNKRVLRPAMVKVKG